jgi:threonine/homoserine/homoserine lactone efflux protein
MEGMPPILLAGLTGCISGLLLSIPVGPVNLTIMNEGARRGFKCAVLISLGAISMEAIYCFVAFTGFARFFQNGWIKSGMELFSVSFMIFLGLRFMMTESVPAVENIEHRIEESIERKLHPTSAFMIGFVRTLANPGVLVGWIFLGTYFVLRGWVEPTWTGKLSCLAGVIAGVSSWFFGLSWAGSLGHGKLNEKRLLQMERGSGVVLLTFALIHGGYIIWEMIHHKR